MAKQDNINNNINIDEKKDDHDNNYIYIKDHIFSKSLLKERNTVVE